MYASMPLVPFFLSKCDFPSQKWINHNQIDVYSKLTRMIAFTL
jgi:hypothetical protein